MADRAVPVMTPARCRPRNSLSMLWRSKMIALLITAVMVSTLEGAPLSSNGTVLYAKAITFTQQAFF